MLLDASVAEVAKPSVLQVIGMVIASLAMLLFAACAFVANCDPNRHRQDPTRAKGGERAAEPR